MDELNSRIEQILNDPGQMEQIFSIARSLGFSPAPEAPAQPEPAPQVSPGMLRILQQASRTDGRQEALLQALKPFLKPDRQRSVERAVQAAQLSRLAGLALRREADTKTE